MKNLKFVLFILTLVSIIGCSSDEPLVVTEDLKLSKITRDNVDLNRFYYVEDRLSEMQKDYYTVDPDTEESTLRTNTYVFEYENDQLVRINSNNGFTDFDYQGNDLVITTVTNQDTFSMVSYHNYLNPSNASITVVNADGLTAKFNLFFDNNNNLLEAKDDNNVLVQEAYPGYYLVSPFDGTFSYDDKKNPYVGFIPEIQLYLTQKMNRNNIIKREFVGDNPYRNFEFEYNEDDYPVSSKYSWVARTTHDTIFTSTTNFYYE